MLPRRTWGPVTALAVLALPQLAAADTANFELNGKIYTKWLYQNDDSVGCLNLSNPFWPDNIGGGNGTCSEFELNILGRVSKNITAGVRLKSRFGALWQDWWENGDVRWDFPTDTLFTENTSGESLGMNHAAYLKLRGAWARIAAPIPTVRWIHVGASDFGMFNAWTIGKSRYIDRDNGYGVFVEGELAPRKLTYHFGAIALPKLYVGPRWNTGLSDADPLATGFWGQDWGYALKLTSRLSRDLELTGIGNYLNDAEINRYDPDLTGRLDAERGADHALSRVERYQGINATLEAVYTPSYFDVMAVRGLLAYGWNRVNPEYATNAVLNDQGFSPLVYLFDEEGNGKAAEDFAGKLRVELFDPLEVGLSLKAEYFNIGSNFNAMFGARRESDVLLTDGVMSAGFIQVGQLPTLNIANEFVDFDEPWYEAIIGWHGGTGLLEYVKGRLRMSGEYTYIGYNTNMQDRNVETEYPDFLYTDGFTDIYTFTADSDYANFNDRGRDPRSVYKEFQDRHTQLAVLKADWLVPGFDGLRLDAKLKYVDDVDYRKADNPDDTYHGRMYMGFANLAYQWTNELKTSLGYEYSYWDEQNRGGNQQQGFFDYFSTRQVGRLGVAYTYGGANFGYILEYLWKDQIREVPGVFDQAWRVWRSKAFLEVAW